MDAMAAILTRRSIRKFKNADVPDSIVKQLIKAAVSAPSAWNQQAWHYIVIRDKEKILSFQNFHPYALPAINTANIVIIVCADILSSSQKKKGLESFLPVDCALSASNILLAAHVLGLGAVYISLWPKEERMQGARDEFSIENRYMPFCFIPIGYPAETREKKHFEIPSVEHVNGACNINDDM